MFELIITCLNGLLGVIVGAVISSASTRNTEKKRLIAEAYGDIIAAYMKWIEVTDPTTTTILVASIERARLFGSDEMDNQLDILGKYITSGKYSQTDSYPVFGDFFSLARKEVRDSPHKCSRSTNSQ